ncbi:MAG TPA: hypothetical protein DCE41_33165 [Cytophagales bacterium]|nr:hypothetical protein [Cytophagales bacterium]HAA19841.1 hypothetical protein [Cytophagales bacterium]HAP63766.1 hypothetical protein [Cytophagales bacterium]
MPFNRLDHDLVGELRPRFRLATTLPAEEVFEQLKAHIETEPSIQGTSLPHYAILKVPAEQAQFWSPELQIRVDQDHPTTDDNHTVLRCLLGPRQAAWSLFAFFYVLVGVITFFGGSYGLVQVSLGKSSPLVWALPIGLGLIFVLWLMAKAGQRASKEQMHHLVSALYHFLDARGELKRVE